MAEPTDAMKEKAREWLAANIHPDYADRTTSRMMEKLADLLAEVEAQTNAEWEPVEKSIREIALQAEAEGAKKERSAVVRWLHRFYNGIGYALQVERGDHLKDKL